MFYDAEMYEPEEFVDSSDEDATNNVKEKSSAGQAAANKSVAKIKFQEATARLQSEGVMGAISNNYYTFFTNNKKGLAGIGALQLVKGKTQRVVTNWGIDWSGVYKTA